VADSLKGGKVWLEIPGRGLSKRVQFKTAELAAEAPKEEADQRVMNLSGVYTISFLLVMAFFAIGNMLLKVKRSRLPRPSSSSWVAVLLATVAVIIGVAGNVLRKPEFPVIFLLFFVPFCVLVIIMLRRIDILRMLAFIVRSIATRVQVFNRQVLKVIQDKINDINSQEIVFFTRGDNIANLNQAMLYVQRNEHTNKMKIVTVVENPRDIPDRLAKDIEFLDEAYPEIDLEFVVRKDKFTPKLLHKLSEEWNIPLNYMFIGSPGDHFPHRISELGGVRLII